MGASKIIRLCDDCVTEVSVVDVEKGVPFKLDRVQCMGCFRKEHPFNRVALDVNNAGIPSDACCAYQGTRECECLKAKPSRHKASRSKKKVTEDQVAEADNK